MLLCCRFLQESFRRLFQLFDETFQFSQFGRYIAQPGSASLQYGKRLSQAVQGSTEGTLDVTGDGAADQSVVVGQFGAKGGQGLAQDIVNGLAAIAEKDGQAALHVFEYEIGHQP